jgi:ABC-type glycerol-3-phosphate transport system substrate-binding protein
MSKNFKFITLISLVSFLIFTGFGCKGMSGKEVAATEKVTLEFWTVYDDVDAMQKIIQKYRETRPYLTINIKQLGYDELYPRLVEALSEDKGPDIISVHARNLEKFKSKLAPMPATAPDTIVTQQKNIANQIETIVTINTINMPTADQIDRSFVQTVKKDTIIDGKIYGLPLSLDTMAIFYNKDLLDRSGVAELPKTWEEFQEAVRKISKFDKETGRIIQSGVALGRYDNIASAEDILYVLFKQSGVDFISDNNQAIFNLKPANLRSNEMTPAMTVMNFYTDFANQNRDTYSWNQEMKNSLDAFIEGKTAFFFGYSYDNDTVKARAPQLNYGIMPMLQLNTDKPANISNYWVQTVVGKSKHQGEAWSFIKYLTFSQATEDYLAETKRPTALRSYVNKQKEDLDLLPFVEQILISDSWYRGQDYDVAKRAVGDMINEWLDKPTSNNEPEARSADQNILNRGATKINQTM